MMPPDYEARRYCASKLFGTPTNLRIVVTSTNSTEQLKGEPLASDKNDEQQESGKNLGILPTLIGYNLRRAQVAVFQDLMSALGDLELTPGLFGVLQIIKNNAGLKQTDLANALHVDRSTVVGVIDKLEKRGLVNRAAAPRDRRSYALYLTDVGEDMLTQAESRVLGHEQRIARNLSTEERSNLLVLLQKVAANDG
jgi:DNA-binding MarR family transcriptional regulator